MMRGWYRGITRRPQTAVVENTDGNSGRKIEVGQTTPEGTFCPGDLWVRLP